MFFERSLGCLSYGDCGVTSDLSGSGGFGIEALFRVV